MCSTPSITLGTSEPFPRSWRRRARVSRGAGFGELLSSWSRLEPGQIQVAVDSPVGDSAGAEQAAITAALADLNSALSPLGISLVEVSADQTSSAEIHIHFAPTSAIGGVDQGVLGTYSWATGDITLIEGWQWYYGANPSQIAPNQYDFQTVVTHEIGHALGLGENSDSSSAMDLYLTAGRVNRQLAAPDLSAIRQELSPSPQTSTAAAWKRRRINPRSNFLPLISTN